MPRQFVIRTILLAMAAGAALPVPAGAQGQDDPYGACAALSDDARRLDCFDTTYAESQSSRASRERAAAEQAQRAEERRTQEFGLSPSERRERREEVAAADPVAGQNATRAQEDARRAGDFSLGATVAEIRQGGTRNQILLLDNGQLWRQTSGSTLRASVKEGWTGTITRHWSGAYEMRFDGRSGYLRLERIQ